MADNVEMTDRSIQGGFSAVCLPRAINRRGRPKEREKEGVVGNVRGGRAKGVIMREDEPRSEMLLGCKPTDTKSKMNKEKETL